MKIDEQATLTFLSSELDAISYHDLPTHSHDCPHCGLPVRYEPVATRQDVKDFQLIMDSARKVMEDSGVNAKLFAAIHAQIAVALANRRSNDDEPKGNL
jgi:hypothetical protein